MPYDPRPINEGGNRSIDVLFSRLAPKGKFRVIGVDTFDGTDWNEGDFDCAESAFEHASAKSGEMLRMYVYDDTGKHIAQSGQF